MRNQAYAFYNSKGRLVGVARNKDVAEGVEDVAVLTGEELRREEISQGEYTKLREQQEALLMEGFEETIRRL